jgi:hypothetical protein
VLTLWAAVVAERLGQPRRRRRSAFSQRRGGQPPRAPRPAARHREEKDHAKERAEPHRRRPRTATARLLGKVIRLAYDKDGVVLAEGGGNPAPARPVQAYVATAFGDRLAEVRKRDGGSGRALRAGELNRLGFRLYEGFPSEVPPDARGLCAKGVLDLGRSARRETCRLTRPPPRYHRPETLPMLARRKRGAGRKPEGDAPWTT